MAIDPSFKDRLKNEYGWQIAEALLSANGIRYNVERPNAVFALRPEDKTPSCKVLMEPHGSLPAGYWEDFGGGGKGDCLSLISAIEGVMEFPRVVERAAQLAGVSVPNSNGNGHAKNGTGKGKAKDKKAEPLEYREPTEDDKEALARAYGLTWQQFADAGAVIVAKQFFRAGNYGGQVPAVRYPFKTEDGSRGNKFKSLHRFEGGKIATPPEGKRLSFGKGGGIFPAAGLDKVKGALVLTGGEEKALAAIAAGFASITWTHGEGNARHAANMIVDAGVSEVILAMDADPAGKTATTKTATALRAAGIETVRAITWPENTPDKWDMADTLREHGPAALRELIANAPQWVPPDWWMVKCDLKTTQLEGARDGSLYETRQGKNGPETTRVSNTIVRIAEVKRRPHNQSTILHCEARCRGRLFQFEIESADWASDANLKAAIGAVVSGFTFSQNAALLLREAAEAIRGLAPPREVTLHKPGVDPTRKVYLLPGLEIRPISIAAVERWAAGNEGAPWGPLTTAIAVEGGHGPEQDLMPPVPESPEQTVRAAQLLCEHFPLLMPSEMDAAIALGVALIGPVLPAILGPPFMQAAFVGTTGSGKTTVARLLANLWGQGSLKAQHSTWRGAAAFISSFRHGLAIVDDLRDGQQIAELVSLGFDGGQRQRLTRSSRLDPSPPLEAATILTGESLHGAGQSTVNRLVQITFPALTEARREMGRAALATLEEAERTLPAITLPVIAAVLGQDKRVLQDRLNALRGIARAEKASERAIEVAARVALCVELLGTIVSALAGGEVAAWIPTGDAVVRAHAVSGAEAEMQAKPATVFMGALAEAIAGSGLVVPHRARWNGTTTIEELDNMEVKPGQVKIWMIEDSQGHGPLIALPPRILLSQLRLDHNETATHDSLFEENMLIRPGKGAEKRRTVKLWVKPMREYQPRKQAWVWLVKNHLEEDDFF